MNSLSKIYYKGKRRHSWKAKAERQRARATVNTWQHYQHYAHILQNGDYWNTKYGGYKAKNNEWRGQNCNCVACEHTVLWHGRKTEKSLKNFGIACSLLAEHLFSVRAYKPSSSKLFHWWQTHFVCWWPINCLLQKHSKRRIIKYPLFPSLDLAVYQFTATVTVLKSTCNAHMTFTSA